MKKRYPFKFLDAYDRKDTDIFFGRDEEIDALYEMTFQSDMLLVYGASGTGKTSLINCGLASRFQAHDWLALNIRRGEDINESLQQKLEEASEGSGTTDLDLSWLDEEEEEQAESPLSQQLRDLYLQHFRPIYLIFDQFEELFIVRSNKAEQAQFIRNVQEIQAVEQPVKMIFVIREEYLGHLFDFERAVPELLRKKLRVEPMNREKVGQVIRGAATLDRSNVRLQAGQEDAIVDGIFRKIRGEEQTLAIQLPYLQVFLDKLYLHITGDEARQADGVFTTGALSQIGDIGDVLRAFLEEQVVRIQRSLSLQHSGIPDDAVWQILSPLATLEGTKEPMMVEALLQRVPHLPQATVREGLSALEKSRILRHDENEDRYEVAHDSLAQRISEHRSDEEIAKMEIRRLITNQMALKAEARALFTEKQLNLIEPYVGELGLEPEALQLIKQSREELRSRARKRQARILVIGAILAASALISILFAIRATHALSKARAAEAAAVQANKATQEALAAARTAEQAAIQANQETERALLRAEEEQRLADSLANVADRQRIIAVTTLNELKKSTAVILDNFLRAAAEDVRVLEYEQALAKIKSAAVLNVDNQKVGASLAEIIYFYNEIGLAQRAVGLADTLSQLLRLPKLQPEQDTLQNVRSFLAEVDAERFDVLERRYFPEMVFVAGGNFEMGCKTGRDGKCKNDELPLHKVNIDSFSMGQTEVKTWQYNTFIRATSRRLVQPAWGAEGDNPAVWISWSDAIIYANWLSKQRGYKEVYTYTVEKAKGGRDSVVVSAVNWQANGYRLPTEAEWEYAARGGPLQESYLFSGSDTIDSVGWWHDNTRTELGRLRTHPVARLSPNGLGLHDMSGNVWEWCWDWYQNDYYKTRPLRNPRGPDETTDKRPRRVLRGGSWDNPEATLRVAYRERVTPIQGGGNDNGYGLRLVRTIR